MPIQNYGLLTGAVINAIPYKSGADHYQIELSATGKLYRIAVDVYSAKAGSSRHYSPQGVTTWDLDREVLFYQDENYSHPMLASLVAAPEGLTAAAQLPQPLLLDYLRYQPALFPIGQMKPVPPKNTSGGGGDLNDEIDPWIQKAMNNSAARLFAFGSSWDDSTSTHPDPTVYWTPNPSLGIHDIHMNQGDSGSEAQNNGTWQDGALFLQFTDGGSGEATTLGSGEAATLGSGEARAAGSGVTPASPRWIAMFFRFANQSINTDDKGNPV
jgi:uncharacterized protein YukJ